MILCSEEEGKQVAKYIGTSRTCSVSDDCSVLPGWLSDYNSGGYGNTTLIAAFRDGHELTTIT